MRSIKRRPIQAMLTERMNRPQTAAHSQAGNVPDSAPQDLEKGLILRAAAVATIYSYPTARERLCAGSKASAVTHVTAVAFF
jgi:hypothetical protein